MGKPSMNEKRKSSVFSGKKKEEKVEKRNS